MGLSLNPLKKIANVVGGFVSPAYHAATGLAQDVQHVATSPIELARAGVAAATHNQAAQNAALNRASAAPKFIVNAVQAAPRAAFQLGESVNPFGGDVYNRQHQFTGAPRVLFGSAPIPSMQTQFKATQKDKGTAFAAGEAALTALTDATGVRAPVSLAKTVIKKPGTAAVEVPQTTQIPISQAGDATPITVRTTTKIPVKAAVDRQELIDRYNQHMANLSQKYSAAQKSETLAGKPGSQAINYEPSIYNDVGYQAEKQKIVEAFNNGTLPKPIKVQDAPNVTTPKAVKIKPTDTPKQVEKKVVQQKTAEDLGLEPGVQGTVNGIDKAARSTSSVLNKLDNRLGSGVKTRRELGEIAAARAKFKMKPAEKLSKDEQANWVDVLEGKDAPINSRVAEAAALTRQELDRVSALSQRVGIKGGVRENYFPHIHNPKQFKEGTIESDQAIKHLIDTGQAKNAADALGLLRKQRNSTKVSPYENLTQARVANLPGYAKSVEAVHQYLDRAYASIAHASVFGAKDEKLNAMLDDIRTAKGDAAYKDAIDAYQRASNLNRGSETAQNISRTLTNVQGATKLGTSAIGNVTQMSNTAVAGGVGRTLRHAVGKLASKENKDFVAKTGVTDEQVSHEALFGEQGVSSRFRNVTAPFFEPIEKNNRANAALVGRDVANKLAQKAAKGDEKAAAKLQRDFGVSHDGSGKLSELDQIKAARAFVARTQFRTQAQDLPAWATTNWGRVVTQFKRYPYKQSQFLWSEVIQPGLHGNLAPLARWASVSVPVALASSNLRAKVRGDNFNSNFMDNLATATGGDIVTGTVNQLTPDSKDGNSYTAKVVKTLGGPTASDAVKAIQAGFDSTKGNFDNAKRFGLQHIPVVGATASNKVAPYQTADSSKPTGDGTVGDNAKKAKQELADFKANVAKGTGEGYGLQKLSDGKYVYNIGGDVKTTGDKKAAQKAIAEDSLKNSDQQSRTLGDTYYYKDVNGDVKSMSNTLHQFNLKDSDNALKMDEAYRAGDWNAWSAVATAQYDALEAKKALYNPDTESDKIVDLTNRQEDLLFKAQTYAEKIANGKGFGASGGGGGSRSSDPFANTEKFRVSAPSGGFRKAAVRSSSGGGSSRRVSVRKSPSTRVAIKKSRV